MHYEADEWLPASGRLKGVDAYDRVLRILSLDKIYELVIQQLVCSPGSRVLDMGCGTGSLASLLRCSYPKARITAVDRDLRMLGQAVDRSNAEGNSWVQGEGQRLPFADRAFDLVTATLFLHHLTPPQKTEALREANRVLRPGGSVHVADWTNRNQGSPRSALSLSVCWMAMSERRTMHPDASLTSSKQLVSIESNSFKRGTLGWERWGSFARPRHCGIDRRLSPARATSLEGITKRDHSADPARSFQRLPIQAQSAPPKVCLGSPVSRRRRA